MVRQDVKKTFKLSGATTPHFILGYASVKEVTFASNPIYALMCQILSCAG